LKITTTVKLHVSSLAFRNLGQNTIAVLRV
jgi:hypothetical protein